MLRPCRAGIKHAPTRWVSLCLSGRGLSPPGNLLEPHTSSKEYRKSWARLIQKIYEADPLLCPRCQARMKVISFIEDPEVIKKILKHLGLWSAKTKPPPRANPPPVHIHLDYSRRGVGPSGPEADSQIPSLDNYFHIDPDYPIETRAS